MTRIRTMGTIVMMGLLAASLGLFAPMAGGEDKQRPVQPVNGAEQPDKDADEQKVAGKVYEGRVVNLHLFLTKHPTPAYSKEDSKQPGAESVVGTLAKEVPIGLWIEQSGLQAVIPGKPVYLLFFDPDNSVQRDAYGEARGMIGKDVLITARMFERGGMKGLQIEKIEAAKPQPVSEADAKK